MATSRVAPDGDGDHGLEWLSLEEDESVLWSGGPDRRTIAPTAALLALPVLALLVVPFDAAAGLALAAVLALDWRSRPCWRWSSSRSSPGPSSGSVGRTTS